MLKELEPIASKLKEERGVLWRALDALTEEQATTLKVNDGWTIKDAIAHLAGAERGMTRIAQGMASNTDPQLPEGYNNDEYNARQVAKRQALPLAEIRNELDDSRNGLMALLEGLTAKQLELCGEHPLAGETALKDLLVIIYNHEVAHCKEITEARANSRI